MIITIDGKPLGYREIEAIIRGGCRIEVSASSLRKVKECRDYLDKKVEKDSSPVYGINTGFGALCNVAISNNDLEKLQVNLVMSHACGTGDEVPAEIVRLMLAFKIQALCYGNSGVQPETVERLTEFFNHDILPVVYTQGSLGASGDLAPLAHLSLPLIGLGEVYEKGTKRNSSDVLHEKAWKPVALKSKEGLALLNGTQFMSSYAAWCIYHAKRISLAADLTAALSLEAYDGRIEPFHPLIQEVRPHAGQKAVAENFRKILGGSELITREKKHVQDPYSFRCIPQVHGASRDAIAYAENIFLTEINSVTDNPTAFPDEDLIISAGNFHGQPLALALDFLSMALAELGNISERRTYQLISGLRGLPLFLVAEPGLNSGFMIPQYTAASVVSQNKQLCSPASVDSIVSSNGQEDHVSMGANAATKCRQVVLNAYTILGIEWLNAAQAIEFRRPAKTSPVLEEAISKFRMKSAFITSDRFMKKEIDHAVDFIRNELEIN